MLCWEPEYFTTKWYLREENDKGRQAFHQANGTVQFKILIPAIKQRKRTNKMDNLNVPFWPNSIWHIGMMCSGGPWPPFPTGIVTLRLRFVLVCLCVSTLTDLFRSLGSKVLSVSSGRHSVESDEEKRPLVSPTCEMDNPATSSYSSMAASAPYTSPLVTPVGDDEPEDLSHEAHA